jgi:phenylalanyl-tRNA synthetase beta chain
MKISYNWLKQYLQLDLAPEEVSDILTSTGLEVEDTFPHESIKGGLKGVVIGKVLSCEKHPNADKLTLTTVDTGNNTPLAIVCGAPNVAVGQHVLVAQVGTVIHMGDQSFEIKNSKIRGEISEGMICAEDELGLGDSHSGIMVLPDDAPVGMPASDYFNVEQDTIFEIGLTPNRSDATSHIGVARDLAAAINFRNKKTACTIQTPSVREFKIDNTNRLVPIRVEDPKACPRYSGLTITGLQIKDSPDWLKNKLLAIGIRPINNVVDITNFVLFETGQPLHAFDLNHVEGDEIVVKKMPQNTPFVTLDEVERKLSANDLMICNALEPMCIGGVFGGLKSGVTKSTTAIFLESACFDPKTIRRTSKFHALQTDASFRFERGTDPEKTVYALKRAALLIQEIAGGKVSSEIQDFYPKAAKHKKIRLDYDYLYKLGGQEIAVAQVISILNDLGVKIKDFDNHGLNLLVPPFKTDVTRPADVVEEVLRIYGYDNIAIPDKIKISINHKPEQDTEQLQNTISDLLSANGFHEIMNNSLSRSAYTRKFDFTDVQKNVNILNPLSTDLDVLRQQLLFGGLESLAYNQNRRNTDLKLYEFGNVYSFKQEQVSNSETLAPYCEEKHLDLFLTGNRNPEIWNMKATPYDFYDLKQALEMVFKRLNISPDHFEINETTSTAYAYGTAYLFNGKEIARAGLINKNLNHFFDLKKEVFHASINWDGLLEKAKGKTIRYEAIPKFPAVRRDLALIVDKSTAFIDLKKAAYEQAPELLVSVTIFDVYEGDQIPADKKSYAISFIMQDKTKTLTDKLIDKTMNKLLINFKKNFGAELR